MSNNKWKWAHNFCGPFNRAVDASLPGNRQGDHPRWTKTWNTLSVTPRDEGNNPSERTVHLDPDITLLEKKNPQHSNLRKEKAEWLNPGRLHGALHTLCSPLSGSRVAHPGTEKQRLALRICLNSDTNLNLALKGMHSRNVKGTRCVGNFSFPVITTSRQGTEWRVYCSSWNQKHRNPARAQTWQQEQHHVFNCIRKAERGSRERLPTLKAHPATGFLQQGFTLPQTVLPARKQVFHTWACGGHFLTKPPHFKREEQRTDWRKRRRMSGPGGVLMLESGAMLHIYKPSIREAGTGGLQVQCQTTTLFSNLYF